MLPRRQESGSRSSWAALTRRVWLAAVVCIGLAAAPADAARNRDDDERLRDLYFGEALFHAHQRNYFDALQRLDTELGQHYELDEPELDSLYYHIGDAEFSVGDFELNYRMHHRAGRAIAAVLEADIDESIRNEAAFRLARIHFQKDQLEDALRALDRIEGDIPKDIDDDIEFLRANIYLATERPGDAVELLRRFGNSEELEAFSAYNLGIALLQDGRELEAYQQLERAGQIDAFDPASLAIRDKSNLVLGSLLMGVENFEAAAASLDRVRLDGPMSNQALLRAGWAEFSAEQFERALVPWGILAERDVTDSAVQEALLGLPYAYAQLEIHGRAALLYGEALESFSKELEKLDASIQSVRDGRFLEALIREEIRQNEDWVILLRTLPETPETYYLMELLASHDFQTALQNYLDLEDLRSRLKSWQADFDAFEDIIQRRRAYYQPVLPVVDSQFRQLDSRIRLRLEQHKALDERLNAMLVSPRPEFLATVEERVVLERLAEIEAGLPAANTALQARIDRLKGVLIWSMRTQYHERLTLFDRHLSELQESIDVLNSQYESFVRARQAAMHSFEGYEIPISRLRIRVREALTRVDLLMARQGRLLEISAVEQFMTRRQRLENYRDQARFAMADSYDRATEAQTADAGIADDALGEGLQ